MIHKALKIGLFLLASCGLFASDPKEPCVESIPSQVIYHQVQEALEISKDIPVDVKTGVIQTWKTLSQQGSLEVSGLDKEVRPYFVTLQGVIEHVLASELQKNITLSRGVIHTPMPATPLCSKGEISKELVDPSIELDPARLFTVKARTTTVRDYLFKGGDLYIVYPKEGYGRRTKEQQAIYEEELKNHPNHLFDVPLDLESIQTNLIGATYLFQDMSGKRFMFGIQMTQAKDPQEMGNFGLWFGPLDHPSIQKRFNEVSEYLKLSGNSIF